MRLSGAMIKQRVNWVVTMRLLMRVNWVSCLQMLHLTAEQVDITGLWQMSLTINNYL